MGENGTIDIAPLPQAAIDNQRRNRLIDVVLLGGSAFITLEACSSDSKPTSPTGSESASSSSSETQPGSCEAPNMSADRADHYFADAHALTDALGEAQADSTIKLMDTKIAIGHLNDQVANDARVAGVFDQLYKFRDDHKDLSTLTPQGIADTVSALQSNTDVANEAVGYTCSQFDFVEPRTDFAVTGGSATEITFNRTDGSHVDRIDFSTIEVSHTVSGFVLGGNTVNANLTPDQISFIKQFMNDVIVTSDGKVIIRNVALSGTAEVHGAAQGGNTDSTSSTGEAGSSTASESSASNTSGTNGGGQQNGTNQGVGQTGGAAGPNGTNPEAGPGGVTSSPGGPGTTAPGPGSPNTTPGTTPNTTPGTTPNTTPNTTTPTTRPAPTTTQPAPTTTRPAPTTTQPTPTTNKPPVTSPGCTDPLNPSCHDGANTIAMVRPQGAELASHVGPEGLLALPMMGAALVRMARRRAQTVTVRNSR